MSSAVADMERDEEGEKLLAFLKSLADDAEE
jgi:hypothetical protein